MARIADSKSIPPSVVSAILKLHDMVCALRLLEAHAAQIFSVKLFKLFAFLIPSLAPLLKHVSSASLKADVALVESSFDNERQLNSRRLCIDCTT